MCDSFVALPTATTTGTTLAAKNADCEINEAQAVLHLPRRRYPEGASVRATHIVIPQARETHEVILDKSFWTWGGEIGLNELTVIQTLLAIVDAQRDYVSLDPMKNGVPTYARRLLSSPGKMDGLSLARRRTRPLPRP